MPYIIILLLAIFSVQAYSIPGNFSLLAPVDNSVTTSTSPVFTWSNSAGATQYYIFLSPNNNFSLPGQFTSQITYYSSYTFNFSLTENATYWWKVHAFDNDITNYMPSMVFSCYINNVQEPPGSFTLNKPSNLEPVYTLRPNFLWNTSIDPDPFDIVKYSLVYSTNSNFIPETAVSPINISNYTLISELFDNYTYYWYVIAFDKNNNKTYSNIGRFYANTTNDRPNAFNLVYPPDKKICTDIQPEFTWEISIDPDPEDTVTYIIYYSTVQDFSVKTTTNSSINSVKITNPLTDRTTYYWKVTASDKYLYKTHSSTSTFILNYTTTPPANFNLAYPENNSIVNELSPELSWETSIDNDAGDFVMYNLYFSKYENFITSISILGLQLTYYSYMDKMSENNTYYWKIIAYDNELNAHLVPSNSIFKFFIPVLSKPSIPVEVKISTNSNNSLVIRWGRVNSNTDGSVISDLRGYIIFKSSSLTALESGTTVFISTPALSYNYTENNNIMYYMIRAVDTSGILSDNSVIISKNTEKIYTASEDQQLIIGMSPSIIQLLDKQNIYNDTLRVKTTVKPANSALSSGLASYDIKVYASNNTEVSDFIFPEPIELAFSYNKYPAIQNKPLVSGQSGGITIVYYNKIEYLNLGGIINPGNKTISISTVRTGEYSLKASALQPQFSIKWLIPDKIFTPNNDGKYDDINIIYNNPEFSKITGKIYDIAGCFIADMVPGDFTDSIKWTGKNNSGNYVQKGIYIYQLVVESENKTFNGAIVVAR